MIITAKERRQALKTAAAVRIIFSYGRDSGSKDAFQEYLHSEYRKYIYDDLMDRVESAFDADEREELQVKAVEWGKFFDEDLFAYVHNAAVSYLRQGVVDYEEAVSAVVAELVMMEVAKDKMEKIDPLTDDYEDFIRIFKTVLKRQPKNILDKYDTYSQGKGETSLEGIGDKKDQSSVDRVDNVAELLKAKPAKVILGLHRKIMKVINSPRMQNKTLKSSNPVDPTYGEIMEFMYDTYSSSLANNRKYRGEVRKAIIKKFGTSAATVNKLLIFFQEMILRILAQATNIDPGDLPKSVQERLQLVASYGKPHHKGAELEKGYVSPREGVLTIQRKKEKIKKSRKAGLLIKLANMLMSEEERDQEWMTIEEVREICPTCATAMEVKNVKKIKASVIGNRIANMTVEQKYLEPDYSTYGIKRVRKRLT